MMEEIAEKMRDSSIVGEGSVCSWSILANLLEEELFLQAAHFLHVSMNATESSPRLMVITWSPKRVEIRRRGAIVCNSPSCASAA